MIAVSLNTAGDIIRINLAKWYVHAKATHTEVMGLIWSHNRDRQNFGGDTNVILYNTCWFKDPKKSRLCSTKWSLPFKPKHECMKAFE